MRKSLLCVALLALVAAAPSTQPGADVWTETPVGKRMLHAFDGAPYPHASRVDGFTNSAGRKFGPEHYQDSTVGIFVPKGYEPRASVDYVVYFHGHGNRVSKVVGQFPVEEQLAKSDVNAILLFPQGPRDAGDSGGGKLEHDEGAFARLLAEVTAYLKTEGVVETDRVGHVLLAPHSGGYRPASAVLKRGGLGDQITDVALLDASYADLDNFVTFAKEHADARVVSFHTKHLDAANAKLRAACTQAGVPVRDVAEAALDATTIAPRGGITFVSTTVSHAGVPTEKDYLALILNTSRLDRR